jgi:hypothetical protein
VLYYRNVRSSTLLERKWQFMSGDFHKVCRREKSAMPRRARKGFIFAAIARWRYINGVALQLRRVDASDPAC